jgi:muramidase (phage lysozyme)/polyisoprenoid-binding protein YceI
MATNPDIFAPSVEPQTQAPNDTIHVDAPSAAFGAPIAQGLEKLGQGVHQAGEFWGQVQTDHQLNGAYQQGEQILANYKKLQGQDALNAQAATKQQLEDVFAKGGAGLTTARQRLQFDNTSRAYLDRFLAPQIDNHADQQGQGVAINTFTDGAKRAFGQVGAVADNPALVEEQVTHAADYLVNAAHARYGANAPDEIIDQAVAQAKQGVYKAQVEALAVKNPALAQKVLDSHKDDLGEAYAPLAEHLQSRADYDTGVQAGQKAIAATGQSFLNGAPGTQQPAAGGAPVVKVSASAAPTPQANALLDVIAGPESGGQYNVLYGGGTFSDLSQFPHWQGAQGPAGTTHAAGGFQFEPATWNEAQQATGVPDFSPQSQQKAAWWLASNTYQKGTGRDLQADLAQGKTDLIAPALQSQWPSINQNSIARLNSDLQTVSAGAGSLPSAAFKASAYDKLMQDPALRDNPRAFQHALSYVNEQASAASIASMENEKARKEAAEASGNAIVTDALNGKVDGIAGRIANDPNLDWQSKIHLTQSIEAMTARDAGRDTKTYGPQFWNAYQRIHLPDGDPQKITSPTQLYASGPNGDLTMSGIDKLSEEIQAKKTPEGEAEATMRRSFLTNARSMISGANEHFGVTDPKGDELFLKFQAQFWPSYQKAREAGESPENLLNPDSPKYLGPKPGSPFIRPPDQWAADTSLANAGSANQNAPKVDLSTPEGIGAAVQNKQLDYWHARDLLEKMGKRSRDQIDPIPIAH